ncbi:Translin [Nadsonia fulvescens var. elongata DSM 6958]|uniref:Translin n=1 Tax=Nadsonia fulvescens var. elongata DSM 6958 TaxID=857566 RepID=A0A1E3PQ63_9ASCO|nr:Translin [Nadsonia fulvescens var. elongata DSM 6958]
MTLAKSPKNEVPNYQPAAVVTATADTIGQKRVAEAHEEVACSKQARGHGMNAPRIDSIEGLFQYCRGSLDAHHDIREKVIKAGRDVTNASKKIIFALQSVRLDSQGKVLFTASINSNIDKGYTIIQEKLQSIVGEIGVNFSHGVHPQKRSKYQHQISGGIQEFVEAVSLECYLREGRIITLREVQNRVSEWVKPKGDNPHPSEYKTIPITIEDFILGLFDLTGELMRFSISNLKPVTASKEVVDPIPSICTNMLNVMREFKTQFDQLNLTELGRNQDLKEFAKKRAVFEASLQKVEFGIYGVFMRINEMT